MPTDAMKTLFWMIFVPLLMAGIVAIALLCVYGVPALLHRVIGA